MKYLLLALLVLCFPLLAGTPVRPVEQVVIQPSIQEIVRAMCLVETDNRPHLRGRSGERGIMQIMRNEWEFATHNLMGASRKTNLLDGIDYSWASAFNKQKNIRVGMFYMQHLIAKYGDWQIAVRVYNAGHRGVHKLNRGNRYLSYVKKAMATGNTAWRKANTRQRRV